MISEVIILAGGMGTRLKGMVPDMPKSMAPVLDHPFLDYQLQYLEEWGISKVIFATGFKGEAIRNYFGNKYKQIELIYSREDEPLGTGGAVKKAMELAESRRVLVVNGDTYYDVHLKRMENFHVSRAAKLSMALHHVEDVSRYGSVEKDGDHKIIAFSEKGKKQGEGFINGGVYLINKDYFMSLDLPEKFSFEKDFLEKYYTRDDFYGMRCMAYFLDIGIPEDYKRAQDDFEGLLS